MFVGRTREMERLNRLYAADGLQVVIIYGRRRVGKTTLLREFCRDKPHLFHVSEEYSSVRGLEDFSRLAYDCHEMGVLPPFQTWRNAFEWLAVQKSDQKRVIVMDEYPYLAASEPSISSTLQHLIDHVLAEANLMLVLCGSSLSFMEKEVLGHKSPLYGRKTAELRIDPLSFFEASEMLPNYPLQDRFNAYGIAGGTPQYLKVLVRHEDLWQAVRMEILEKGAMLYDEPLNLLRQELREPMVYNTILEAIATGSSRMNEICTRTGMTTDKVSRYLVTLQQLGIVIRETPAGEKEGRKSIWRLEDPLFRFWFRFVFPNRALLEQDEAEWVFKTEVEPNWSDHMGRSCFEDVCRQYLWQRNRERSLPFVFQNAGRWWGSDSERKLQVEIDIIAYDRSRAIFCECKWRNEPTGLDVLTELRRKAAACKLFKPARFILFSRSVFTEGIREAALREGDVDLVSLQDFERMMKT